MKKFLFLSVIATIFVGQAVAQDYHWPLKTDLSDIVGAKNGTNQGVVFDTDAERGAVAVFNGDGYANLPSFIEGEDLTELTVSVWFKMDEVRPWSRLYSIGNGDQVEPKDVIMIIPVNGMDAESGVEGFYRFTLTDPDGPWADIDLGAENGVNVEVGKWCYSTVVLKTDSIILYFNDVQVFAESGFPRSIGTLSDTQNALGKSFWADQFFKGAMSDLRVYKKALTKEEVAENYLETSTTTGIAQQGFAENNISVYVSNGKLMLKADKIDNNQMVSVYSLSGKLVANSTVSQISNITLKTGFYIVNIKGVNGTDYNTKIVVK